VPLTVIVNPNSGGGRARQVLTQLGPALKMLHPDHRLHLTEGPGDAVKLARAAADDGATAVVACGGDGTLHEVVNGVLSAAKPVPVGLIPGGRGSDFARGAGIPLGVDQCLELLAKPPKALDAGKVTLPGKVEYFVNIADAGLGGFTVETANRWRLPVSGQLTYFAASAWGLFKYTGSQMTLKWDGGEISGRFLVVAVGNGSYFGGGMHVCPTAKPDDGKFDVVVMEARGFFFLVSQLPALYGGKLPGTKGVHSFQCTRLTLESPETVPLDLDGERAEGVPVTFEMMPGALQFFRP
jgi:diacylglycerol kinase (ATP)